MKSQARNKSHLSIREFSLSAGEEWTSPLNGWVVLLVRRGFGFYLHPSANQQLEAGTALLAADGMKGSVRASQVGGITLCVFNILPARLTGLLSLPEQDALNLVANRSEKALQLFPPGNPLAVQMTELCTGDLTEGLSLRLKLLQVFSEMIGKELAQPVSQATAVDVRQKLEKLLKETPVTDLVEMNFEDMAKMTHCTTRHLSRIFRELVGMSFREKRSELRLEKARELLVGTDAKVVDLALECGYKSLSLFNLMFYRRYGMSPGKWRQKKLKA